MEIEVPKTLKDCTIEQVWSFSDFINGKTEFTIEDRVKIVSIFSGIGEAQLLRASIDNINSIVNHILALFQIPEDVTPIRRLKLNGGYYTLRDKLTAGQFIDFETLGKTDPAYLCAIAYVEEGMAYSQVDDEGFVLNPLDARAEIMREYMNGHDFLRVMVFFLDWFGMLKSAILVQEGQRLRKMRRKLKSLR